VVDVLLELADGFGAEGVRDGFAFAGVLCAVAGVEEPTADGDEGVVVVAVAELGCDDTEVRATRGLPLEETVAMSVYDRDGVRVSH
jgi:hypothetical protein